MLLSIFYFWALSSLAICIISFWNDYFNLLLIFIHWVASYYWVVTILCIFGIPDICQIYVLLMFSLSMCSFFSLQFLSGIFWSTEILNFDEIWFLCFLFIEFLGVTLVNKYYSGFKCTILQHTICTLCCVFHPKSSLLPSPFIPPVPPPTFPILLPHGNHYIVVHVHEIFLFFFPQSPMSKQTRGRFIDRVQADSCWG